MQSMRNLEEYNGKFAGETAYIIGSGPSLCTQDLSRLKEGVRFTINSGYLALPSSDFFVTDDAGVASWSYFKKDLLSGKETTILLYEDKFKDTHSYLGERVVWFRHRTGYNLTETYSHEQYKNRVWQARSSVGTAIHIAYIMGCRRIVLLGIDCKHIGKHRYFWQLRGPQPTNLDARLRLDQIPKEYNVEGSAVRSDDDLMEILNYWNSIADELKAKCEILNASPWSVLECFEKVNFADVSQ